MGTIIIDIVAAAGLGGLLTAVVMAYINRRRLQADTNNVMADTAQKKAGADETVQRVYQKMLADQIGNQALLKADVVKLKEEQQATDEKQRLFIASLMVEIADLKTQLGQAYTTITESATTIKQLREDIKVLTEQLRMERK